MPFCLHTRVHVCECAIRQSSVLIPSYLCNVIPQNYKRSLTNIRPNLYPLLDRLTFFQQGGGRRFHLCVARVQYTLGFRCFRCLATLSSEYTSC